jgi:hypothetical protein
VKALISSWWRWSSARCCWRSRQSVTRALRAMQAWFNVTEESVRLEAAELRALNPPSDAGWRNLRRYYGSTRAEGEMTVDIRNVQVRISRTLRHTGAKQRSSSIRARKPTRQTSDCPMVTDERKDSSSALRRVCRHRIWGNVRQSHQNWDRDTGR